MVPTRMVISRSERLISITHSRTVALAGMKGASQLPKAEMTALTTRETSRRNARPSTIPSERTRLNRNPFSPPFAGSGVTPQARFSANCSSTKAPVEPISSITMPIAVAQPPPLVVSCARAIICCTCSVASAPTSPESCLRTSP